MGSQLANEVLVANAGTLALLGKIGWDKEGCKGLEGQCRACTNVGDHSITPYGVPEEVSGWEVGEMANLQGTTSSSRSKRLVLTARTLSWLPYPGECFFVEVSVGSRCIHLKAR